MHRLFGRAFLCSLVLAVGAVPTIAEDRSAPVADFDSPATNILQLAIVAPSAFAGVGPIPSDGELRSRGARIGRIHVVIDEVFEQSTSLSVPYRLVNRLHLSTHEATILQQLLFHDGDPFDRRVLDEFFQVGHALPWVLAIQRHMML